MPLSLCLSQHSGGASLLLVLFDSLHRLHSNPGEALFVSNGRKNGERERGVGEIDEESKKVDSGSRICPDRTALQRGEGGASSRAFLKQGRQAGRQA